MIRKQTITFILFSFILTACGQQGPLFMPIENESIEDTPIDALPKENTPKENIDHESEAN